MQMIGFVVWEGKSNLSEDEIVAILTLKSKNVKTGPMLQLWILLKDIHPSEGVKSGNDYSICGSCIHRGNAGKDRTCYVKLFMGPNHVYKAYKAGKYENSIESAIQYIKSNNSKIRLGAYGDPGLIPYEILSALLENAKGWTGYTHQWRNIDKEYSNFLMASCDKLEDLQECNKLGYRGYLTTKAEYDIIEEKEKKIVLCPASDESKERRGSAIQCINCQLCSGNRVKAKNIYIPVHGNTKNKFELTLKG